MGNGIFPLSPSTISRYRRIRVIFETRTALRPFTYVLYIGQYCIGIQKNPTIFGPNVPGQNEQKTTIQTSPVYRYVTHFSFTAKIGLFATRVMFVVRGHHRAHLHTVRANDIDGCPNFQPMTATITPAEWFVTSPMFLSFFIETTLMVQQDECHVYRTHNIQANTSQLPFVHCIRVIIYKINKRSNLLIKLIPLVANLANHIQ